MIEVIELKTLCPMCRKNYAFWNDKFRFYTCGLCGWQGRIIKDGAKEGQNK